MKSNSKWIHHGYYRGFPVEYRPGGKRAHWRYTRINDNNETTYVTASSEAAVKQSVDRFVAALPRMKRD